MRKTFISKIFFINNDAWYCKFSSVKTKTDAHIALTTSESDSNLYEIVIGGWSNGQSVIRKGKQGTSIGSHVKVN